MPGPGGGSVAYCLGVDLGTTFVAAAVAHGPQVEMYTLGDRSVVSPAAVHAREDGRLVTGDAAIRRAVSNPDRVCREFKRRLGDPIPVILGGASFPVTMLLGAVLRDVVERVSDTEGHPPDGVVLTHPANWGPYRRELFDEVPDLAGLTGSGTGTDSAGPALRAVTEPEAAAAHYAASRRLGEGDTVAVYDLGGGTFDATVLRKRADGIEILGTPEGIERLGGVDFDEAILAFVNYQADGALTELDLGNLQTSVAMARLRQDCVLAKEALSIDTETTIPVFLPQRHFDVRLTLSEFEDMIRAQVESTIGALRRTLHSARVTPEDLSAVLLVGGSSRIPLVARMLSDELDRPIVVDTHPKYAVALGAAELARADAGGAAPPGTGSSAIGHAAAPAAPGLSRPADPPRPVGTTPAPSVPRNAGGPRPTVATGDTGSPGVPRNAELPRPAAGAGAAGAGSVRRNADLPRPAVADGGATGSPGVPRNADPSWRGVATGGTAAGLPPPAGAADLPRPVAASAAAPAPPVPPTPPASIAGPGPAPQPTAGPAATAVTPAATSATNGASATDGTGSTDGTGGLSGTGGTGGPPGTPPERPGWSGGPHQPSHGGRRRRSRLLAAAVVAVLALAAGVAYFGTPFVGDGNAQPRATEPPSAGGVAVAKPIPTLGEAVPAGASSGFVAISPNGRLAYVANRTAGVVTVIDTSVNAVTATIEVPAGPPQYVAFAPDGGHVYVSVFDEARTIAAVAVLDTTTNSVVATVPVQTRPFALAVAPDGGKVYVPNHDSGTVSVIDTATNALANEIVVAPNPHWVAITPDGSRFYTANHESNLITALDTANDRIVAEIPVGTSPHSVAVNPVRPLVANVNYDSASLSITDRNSDEVVATVPVGRNPQAVAWSPDGRFAYTANVTDDTVSVVSAESFSVTATVPTGDGPTSIAVLPNGTQAYVSNLNDGTLTVLDLAG
ncbi:Hsp70 family protein [Pseudonocardia nantongensis]|uniref:Hsp70 family protein n=1 Tax=Pseudonocardia nantongensis TaxID=1181885 RepID=UPI00397917FA